MIAGGDCIDDVELLRCGSTASVLGHRVMAASTVGTWLRSFSFGHVRQLDKVTGELPARAWVAGAGPGDGPLTVDVDSTICEVHGCHQQGAGYGYPHRLGYHPLLATRAEGGEVLHARLRKGAANTARGILRFVDELIARLRRAGASGELTLRADSGFWSAKLVQRLRHHRVRYSITVRQTKTVRVAIAQIPEQAWTQIAYPPDGVAQVAETPWKGDRLIVRRGRNAGDQAQLFATWRDHAFVTNRVGATTWLDADHRRHAVSELAIRDLKAGAGLAPCLRAGSPPTAPGCWPPLWPTTCCAGPPGSVWAATASNWSPRRCAGHSSCCPAGSPTPGGSGCCTYPPAGRGPTRSPWRWLGSAASPTRPDRTPTPSLGSSATRRLLRPAHHGGDRPPSRPTTSSPHPQPPDPAPAVTLCQQPHSMP
jgi:Transposase DDE domain group 1